MTDAINLPHRRGGTSPAGKDASAPSEPAAFAAAVESMYQVRLRPEIARGTIRPPQRLAPFSHAIGLEVDRHPGQDTPTPPENSTDTEGDAFGRLIALYDPHGTEHDGDIRLVAYIQADMDSAVAADPMLPDVAWEWLTEALASASATYTDLGGTVTSTASVRFGDIGGVPRAHQLEMRASWTVNLETSSDLGPHILAFSQLLASVAGLPPEGVATLKQPRT